VPGTFKPLKSAGTDESVPALLQQGMEHLVPHLCRIFRACLAYGFTAMAWWQVKVTFTQKHRKFHYNEDKAYRPISLLKMMEKLVDRHIMKRVLKEHFLHQIQHAYQIGKSNKTALHNVVTHTESAIKYLEITL
jgi:hypothetical protein